MAPSQRMVGIQALRLIAALLVVLHHAQHHVDEALGVRSVNFLDLRLGATGVFIFFVISGYVITTQIHAHPVRFAMHRILRLYPAHFIAMAIGTATAIAIGAAAIEDVRFGASLLLLPGGRLHHFTLIPYWSLVFEMFFYSVVFVFLLGGRERFDALLIVWALVILVINLTLPVSGNATPRLSNVASSPWTLLFIAGAALARAHAGKCLPLAAIAAAGLSLGYQFEVLHLTRVLLAAGGTLALIHLAAVYNGGLARVRLMRRLARGGDWSYGLYLLHRPVVAAVCATVPAATLPWHALLAVAVFAGCAVGLAFGWLEHRAYRRHFRALADRAARALVLGPRQTGRVLPALGGATLAPQRA